MLRGAHDGAVAALEWVPGQPLLVSAGADNSVKQWAFDGPTAPPRLLKFRAGHHAPPHIIRFYGEDGKQLLTAGRDRTLRYTSVVRDARSFELSQGTVLSPVGTSQAERTFAGSISKKATQLSVPVASLKFPPITAFAYSATRSKDWDDVVTAHADETFARTWSVQGKKLGKYAFDINAKDKKGGAVGSVKAVCVSACGNFAVVGSSTGEIEMWNLQSGMKRKSFALEEPAKGKKKKGERRCVTGLASDALNRVVVASTLDGTVNVRKGLKLVRRKCG